MNQQFNKDMEKAVQITTNQQINSLQRIYRGVSKGECPPGCANCCMESVETHYIEFIQIYKYLKSHPSLWGKLLPKIIYFYFHELSEKRECAFLNEKKQCDIYEVRPLPCRMYGYLNEKDYEVSYERIRQQGEEASMYLHREYGVGIAEKVLKYKVPYCHDFKLEEINKLSKEQTQEIADELIGIQFSYFMEGLIDLEHITYSLMGWCIKLLMSEEEMNSYRIQVAKEIEKEGQSSLFHEILEKYKDKKLIL